MQARSGEQGFTLIELLVTLALLALMTVYTVHAFTAMQDMSRVADDMARDQEIDAALRHVRDAISDARTVFQPDGRGGQILLFEGGSKKFSHLSRSQPASANVVASMW